MNPERAKVYEALSSQLMNASGREDLKLNAQRSQVHANIATQGMAANVSRLRSEITAAPDAATKAALQKRLNDMEASASSATERTALRTQLGSLIQAEGFATDVKGAVKNALNSALSALGYTNGAAAAAPRQLMDEVAVALAMDTVSGYGLLSGNPSELLTPLGSLLSTLKESPTRFKPAAAAADPAPLANDALAFQAFLGGYGAGALPAIGANAATGVVVPNAGTVQGAAATLVAKNIDPNLVQKTLLAAGWGMIKAYWASNATLADKQQFARVLLGANLGAGVPGNANQMADRINNLSLFVNEADLQTFYSIFLDPAVSGAAAAAAANNPIPHAVGGGAGSAGSANIAAALAGRFANAVPAIVGTPRIARLMGSMALAAATVDSNNAAAGASTDATKLAFRTAVLSALVGVPGAAAGVRAANIIYHTSTLNGANDANTVKPLVDAALGSVGLGVDAAARAAAIFNAANDLEAAVLQSEVLPALFRQDITNKVVNGAATTLLSQAQVVLAVVALTPAGAAALLYAASKVQGRAGADNALADVVNFVLNPAANIGFANANHTNIQRANAIIAASPENIAKDVTTAVLATGAQANLLATGAQGLLHAAKALINDGSYSPDVASALMAAGIPVAEVIKGAALYTDAGALIKAAGAPGNNLSDTVAALINNVLVNVAAAEQTAAVQKVLGLYPDGPTAANLAAVIDRLPAGGLPVDRQAAVANAIRIAAAGLPTPVTIHAIVNDGAFNAARAAKVISGAVAAGVALDITALITGPAANGLALSVANAAAAIADPAMTPEAAYRVITEAAAGGLDVGGAAAVAAGNNLKNDIVNSGGFNAARAAKVISGAVAAGVALDITALITGPAANGLALSVANAAAAIADPAMTPEAAYRVITEAAAGGLDVGGAAAVAAGNNLKNDIVNSGGFNAARAAKVISGAVAAGVALDITALITGPAANGLALSVANAAAAIADPAMTPEAAYRVITEAAAGGLDVGGAAAVAAGNNLKNDIVNSGGFNAARAAKVISGAVAAGVALDITALITGPAANGLALSVANAAAAIADPAMTPEAAYRVITEAAAGGLDVGGAAAVAAGNNLKNDIVNSGGFNAARAAKVISGAVAAGVALDITALITGPAANGLALSVANAAAAIADPAMTPEAAYRVITEAAAGGLDVGGAAAVAAGNNLKNDIVNSGGFNAARAAKVISGAVAAGVALDITALITGPAANGLALSVANAAAAIADPAMTPEAAYRVITEAAAGGLDVGGAAAVAAGNNLKNDIVNSGGFNAARAAKVISGAPGAGRAAVAKGLVEAAATGVAGVASGIVLANKASTDNVKALLALTTDEAKTQQALANFKGTWEELKAAVLIQIGNVVANQPANAVALLKAAIADGKNQAVGGDPYGQLLGLTLATLAVASNQVNLLATLLSDATVLGGLNGALANNPASLVHKAQAAASLLSVAFTKLQSDAEKQAFVTTLLSLPADTVVAAAADQKQANVQAVLGQLPAANAATVRSLILQAPQGSQKLVADAAVAVPAAVGAANASSAAVTLVSGAEKAADRITLAKAMIETLTAANGAAFAAELEAALAALNPATEAGFNQVAQVLAASIDANPANAVALIKRAMDSAVLVAVLPGAGANADQIKASRQRNLTAKVVEFLSAANKTAVTQALYADVVKAFGQTNAVGSATVTANASNLQALAIANRVAA